MLPRNLEKLILKDETVAWKAWVEGPYPYEDHVFDHSLQDIIDVLGDYLRYCAQHAAWLECLTLNLNNIIVTWGFLYDSPTVRAATQHGNEEPCCTMGAF
jgi:hypothetical protein